MLSIILGFALQQQPEHDINTPGPLVPPPQTLLCPPSLTPKAQAIPPSVSSSFSPSPF